MRSIDYNSQRNNMDFNGQFHGWQQCFSTSSWMLMSYWCPSIKGKDDAALSAYVDDVCNKVGSSGIGEKVAAGEHIPSSENTAYYWSVQCAAVEKWLTGKGLGGKAVWYDGSCSWPDFIHSLSQGPAVLGTSKMGGLPGGHIILAVDTDGENLIVNDPYGDALTGYRNPDGAMKKYPISWIKPFTGQTGVRCLMWRPS